MLRGISRPLSLVVFVQAFAFGAAAQEITATMLTTFTNPNPVIEDNFGTSLAVVGHDRVLVGAHLADAGAINSGAAYLLRADGSLLLTITNPSVASDAYFGWAVASVGSDALLIGAYLDDTGATNSGAAHLFSTNGVLLTKFVHPMPTRESRFGYSLKGMENERVVIGAPSDTSGARGAGAAFLFSTNGTLLAAFTNPSPTAGDNFGQALAVVGSDRVLIGALNAYQAGLVASGAAFLFDTNGVLLTTFANPRPAVGAHFGTAVFAMGHDRVVIGANHDSTLGTWAGAAYLFHTNGTLLATFTNPLPTSYRMFGTDVAELKGNRVVVTAPGDNTGANWAGAVHLFNTNGVLLTTITNPTPALMDIFGLRVVAYGYDRLFIGAPRDDIGATDAGVVLIFILDIPYPPLAISKVSAICSVSWLSDEPSMILQQADFLDSPALWTDTPETAVTNGLTNLVQQTVPAGVTNRYYRLRRP